VGVILPTVLAAIEPLTSLSPLPLASTLDASSRVLLAGEEAAKILVTIES
jgi:hypothetical protein